MKLRPYFRARPGRSLTFFFSYDREQHHFQYSMTNQDISYIITRAGFCATATHYAMFIGENIAIDLATKAIMKGGSSKDTSFLVEAMHSILRGRTIKDVIPWASNFGKSVGAITISVIAPILCDIVYPSYIRVFKAIKDQESKAASKLDYLLTVGISAIGIWIGIDFVKNISSN